MKNATNTIDSITMQYGNSSYQQYMQFVPQLQNVSDPDELYYVYSYQYLIYLVNQCLKPCLTGLGNSNLVDLSTNVESPYMNFDINSQLCCITVNDNFFGCNETGKINLNINFPMYVLFYSLPSMLVNKNVSGMDYQLNNLISQDSTVLSQDYSTVALWNPVSSGVFTSTEIPIYHSQTPPIEIITALRITS